MSQNRSSASVQGSALHKASHRVSGLWQTLHASALLVAATLSPATYTPAMRRAVAAQICRSSTRLIPVFVLLSTLLSVVLVHIVVVTAQSYGLSQFALGMVIRVLVIELLPLSAALYVSLRAGMVSIPEDKSESPASIPDVVANFFAVISLATLSALLSLFFAYLGVYGFTPWGLSSFTRTIGQVFGPIAIMSLGLKSLLFALAVATIPATARPTRPGQGTARLFMALIAIEILSLVAEFF